MGTHASLTFQQSRRPRIEAQPNSSRKSDSQRHNAAPPPCGRAACCVVCAAQALFSFSVLAEAASPARAAHSTRGEAPLQPGARPCPAARPLVPGANKAS